MEITHAEQVFVNDITYIKTDEGHAYLALVTDAYSKKIMGWSFDNNMKVSMVKQALSLAHSNCIFNHQTTFTIAIEESNIAVRITQNLLAKEVLK